MARKKPQHTIRINHANLEFAADGIFINQAAKRYAAKVVEIDDQEYFVIEGTYGKVWVEIDYTEK